MMTFLLALQLWTSIPDSTALLQGHWISCFQEGEGYSEAAYDHARVVKGERVIEWSLHLGPYDSFALFKGEEPEGDDHDSVLNLLTGHHALALGTPNGRRNWSIPSLNLWVSVVQAGEPKEGCEAWLIRVTRLK